MAEIREEKLKQLMATSLAISPEQLTDDLSYNAIREWDSIAHMTLVASLENEFDLMLDTQDILDMNSYGVLKQILAKYDILIVPEG